METPAPANHPPQASRPPTVVRRSPAIRRARRPLRPLDSIAGLLAGTPELSSLQAAIAAAGMGEALSGPQPFTRFAPNNAAFAALPQSIVDRLLANPEALSQVLQYHAARGLYSAADLRTVQPSTLNGKLLTITPQGEGLTVNAATVVTADVAASNGFVHIIDRVLLPPLAEGVRPPVIDASGVPAFAGPQLTVVGTAEPGRTLIVTLNEQPLGAPAVVDVNGNWQVTGDVTPGEYRILAFMLNGDLLEAIAPPVTLPAR